MQQTRPQNKNAFRYLANYLAESRNVDIMTNPNTYDNPKPLTAKQIQNDLNAAAANSSEALYEYLEDFTFITDPLFDLYVDTLSTLCNDQPIIFYNNFPTKP